MIEQDHPRQTYARMAESDCIAARADAAERVKIQWSIADATLKAMLLANGGAMIALFTFVGNVMSRAASPVRFDGPSLRWAFGLFVAGLVLALVAHLFAFMSQDRFYNQAMREVWRQQEAAMQDAPTTPSALELQLNTHGNRYYVAGLAAIAVSIVAFIVGCGLALTGVPLG